MGAEVTIQRVRGILIRAGLDIGGKYDTARSPMFVVTKGLGGKVLAELRYPTAEVAGAVRRRSRLQRG